MTTLRELKQGALLHTLVALQLLGEPVSIKRLVEETGWSADKIREALEFLASPRRGLVTAVAHGRHRLWALTAGAEGVEVWTGGWVGAAPLPGAAPPEEAEIDSADSAAPPAESVLEPAACAAPPVAEVTPRIAVSDPIALTAENRIIESDQSINSDSDGPALYAHMLQALGACGIYFQLRPRLARELSAQDGRVWLRQVLGWLAYAVEAGADTESRLGATIYPVLRDRQTVPDRYLPPPGLPFTEALAWAQGRGQAASPVETPRWGVSPRWGASPSAAPDAAPASTAPGVAPPPMPEATVWAGVLKRLRGQVTGEVFAGRLANTRLTRSPAGAWVLLAPSPYAADWLRYRLGLTLTRELSALVGDPALELCIEADTG